MSVFRIVKDALTTAASNLQALVLNDAWSNWFVPDKMLSPVVVRPPQNRPQSRSVR